MPYETRDLTDPFAYSMKNVPDRAYLTSQAHWIRNILDPRIAHSGPEALSVNDVLGLDVFLRNLMQSTATSLADLRSSRMHLAILEICGRATRWPKKLIERAEVIEKIWEEKFGPLKALEWDLFEEGGRLQGWKGCEGMTRDEVQLKWMRDPDIRVGPGRARKWGDLGFKPGDWWINPLFAYRAGILDSGDLRGGIVSDSKGAYAILMTSRDEISSETPEKFVYRARDRDRGRYRLTAATIDSRHPIRVLRNHTLRSFWSPKAGVRYEGLYKVVSWSISLDPLTNRTLYDITLSRSPGQKDMNAVLEHPWAEEVEDYKEYKRLRTAAREKFAQEAKAEQNSKPDLTVTGSDGTGDDNVPPGRSHPFRDSAVKVEKVGEVLEDETAESPSGSVIVGGMPRLRSGPGGAGDHRVLRDITP